MSEWKNGSSFRRAVLAVFALLIVCKYIYNNERDGQYQYNTEANQGKKIV